MPKTDDTTNKNKRQIYVWDDNLEFFNSLKNRSKFVNLLIRKYREEYTPDNGNYPIIRQATK